MNKASKFLLLLILGSINWSLVQAQIYIGYDVGISSHTLSDGYFGENYYENISPSFFNLTLQFFSDKRVLSLGLSSSDIEMSPALNQINYHSTDNVKSSEYKINLKYLGKDRNLTNQLALFLGGSINGRYFSSFREIDSDFSNLETNSREIKNINLSLNSLLEYKLDRFSINYNVGISFLNFFFKTNKHNQYEEDSEFKVAGFSEYIEWNNSVSGKIELSERFILKSEFLIRYVKFTDGDQIKMLDQAILIGGLVRL